MRILLAIHNAYTDSESGAAHSIRILMKWLAEAGHECRVLATARFDARPPDIDEHLAGLGVELRRRPPAPAFVRSVRKPANMVVGRPTVQFTLAGVPITMLLTRHNEAGHPDRFESAQFLYLLDQMLKQFRPDLLLTYGAHPVLHESLRRARARGVTTVFTIRNHGYEDRRFFEHVDHVFTTSPYLSDLYKQKIGLVSTGIPSPIDWSEVLAPADSRTFVTYVNPSVHKGAGVFARLADMLGTARPDIPILVVQSASSAGVLNAIPGIDFAADGRGRRARTTRSRSTLGEEPGGSRRGGDRDVVRCRLRVVGRLREVCRCFAAGARNRRAALQRAGAAATLPGLLRLVEAGRAAL